MNEPDKKPDAPRGRGALALALGVGVALGVGFGAWRWRPRASQRAATVASTTPATLASVVPDGARMVLVADVAQLRRVPALAPLFAATPGEQIPCETRLLRGVSRLAAFARASSFDDLTVAFEGPQTREELLACARSRQGAAPPELLRYFDVDLLRVAQQRQEGLLPAADPSEIAYVPGGVVLAGPSSSVRSTIDRVRVAPPAAPPGAIAALLSKLTGERSVELAVLMSDSTRNTRGFESVLAHVAGIALAVRTTSAIELDFVLACDDFDSPRAVADAVTAMRDRTGAELQLAPLARAIREATVERRATDVRVRLSFQPAEVAAIFVLLRATLF